MKKGGKRVEKLTILVDMDDTMVDLMSVWIARLNKQYGLSIKNSDICVWDLMQIFTALTKEQIYAPLHDPELWDELQPIEGSVKYIKKLIDDGHNVYVVTSAHYKTFQPKIEKVILKYFPYISWRNVIVTSKKQMIKGDILIDDAVHNHIGGDYQKFLMNAPHNQSYDAEENRMIRVSSWKEIYELIVNICGGVK